MDEVSAEHVVPAAYVGHLTARPAPRVTVQPPWERHWRADLRRWARQDRGGSTRTRAITSPDRALGASS